ncbi:MAG TPA: DUF4388 domain-containing protein, partial [Pyrinomonadaceae bacterium]|nr:DUF4388 domain-containing protein [Pyrinomonadaceae bacterium]
MALTGQLSDMSLAELIEFFCNQRKTGRLKVDYHRGHGVFFIKSGELVDAKVGALSGAEAVYFALTLPNAAFDFSADFEPPRRTIDESWKQVVLEGLRRLDEGLSPTEADVFGDDSLIDALDAELSSYIERSKRSGEDAPAQTWPGMSSIADAGVNSAASTIPLSMMVDSASAPVAKKKWIMGAVVGCVILACAVIAIPLSGRLGGGEVSPSQPEAVADANESVNSDAASSAAPAAPESTPDATAAQPIDTMPTIDPGEEAAAAARREAREREARERRAEVMARKAEAALKANEARTAGASGPKSIKVSVAYDESGR